jgi:hypothetical protein
MSVPFFVTGLPRSRTAWFAVATSTAKATCWHEPGPMLPDFDALRSLWLDPSMGVAIGVSDSSLAPMMGRILREIKPRTLLIQRPKHEALASFSAYMKGSGVAINWQAVAEHADRSVAETSTYGKHPLVKKVEFDALNDLTTMRECLNWLLPDEAFPDLSQLMRMNIQSDLAYNIEAAGKLKRTERVLAFCQS